MGLRGEVSEGGEGGLGGHGLVGVESGEGRGVDVVRGCEALFFGGEDFEGGEARDAWVFFQLCIILVSCGSCGTAY